MRRGVAISVGLHALVAVLTIVAFPSFTPELPPIPPNIPVELVTIGDVTNIKKIDKVEDQPKPEEKPSEPEPEPMRTAVLPPAPELKPAPEPVPPPPELKLEPEPKPVEKKAEEKKPEPPKPETKPTPPQPPKKKEQAFDASKIAALLNKLPPKEKATDQGEEKKVVTGPQQTEAVGEATGMTASAKDAIAAQMQRCWTLPAGAPNPQDLIVRVRFGLNEDGTLARAPELTDTARLAMGDPYYNAAANNAIRAIHVCTPFKLPPGVWNPDFKDIEMNFDPRAALGG